MTDSNNTTGPAGDMWRVDVAGVPVSVRGRQAMEHLEMVNRQLAVARLALHKVAQGDSSRDVCIALRAIEDIRYAR